MGLKTYKEKRDFTQTSEPEGKERPSHGTLIFVIQKHDATRLHYDVRLEMEGVLKSWAVPKGPSLNPATKSLAMFVEDHPFDYKDFEGTIPAGNYGAGNVIIWDNGTYYGLDKKGEKTTEKQLLSDLKKGHVRFFLEGKKLRGAFSLVRINDSEQKNAWLLFKKDDEFASEEDVLLQDKSIISGKTVENIGVNPRKKGREAAGAGGAAGTAGAKSKTSGRSPRTAKTSKAEKNGQTGAEGAKSKTSAKSPRTAKTPKAEKNGNETAKTSTKSLRTASTSTKSAPTPKSSISSSLPDRVKPMLAVIHDEPFDNPNWVFEIKHDGYRAVAGITRDGNVDLYSRNLLSFNQKYPEVVAALKAIGHDAILDGELVIEDESGLSRFQLLQNYQTTGEGTPRYYVFDLLYLNGFSTVSLTLLERKELLKELLKDVRSEIVLYSDHVVGDGISFYAHAKERNVEGIIAKDGSSPYRVAVRSNEWLKIRHHKEQEAIIVGFTPPKGSRKHFGALLLGAYEDGKLTYIGKCGTGYTEAVLKDLYNHLKPYFRDKSPLSIRIREKVQWVEPKVVCQVRYTELTDEGIMRHPVFLGLREDKPAEEVVPEAEQTATEEPKRTTNKIDLTIGNVVVHLTNQQKVFWPKEGYTKGDLITYYEQVAEFILPYLKDRPESMNRFPNGITGKSFYQKDQDKEATPDWVRTESIYSESNQANINYLICDDLPTLLYMVNLGCIEINPWNARFPQVEHPDWMVIDLDPEDIGFQEVVKVALGVRKALEALEVEAYCKTSGATGLHIYVPMGAQYDHDMVKDFTNIIVAHVHDQFPDTTSLERSPSKRKKKIYLDYLQNRKGQTLAAPYCVRPKPGATVSTPLKWSEVNAKLDPQQFTIRTILNRLEKIGDIWGPVLGKGVDIAAVMERMSEAWDK